MKKIATLSIITGLTFPMLVNADRDQFYDYARVLSSEPIYETFEHRIPQESCWIETVREERPKRGRSHTPTIVGGIIGGAIGNAVGSGDKNKKIGAVVGSVLGMSIGSDISRKHGRDNIDIQYRDVERCETHYNIQRESKLTGYDVTYKYRGNIYTTSMSNEPGKRIKVAVSVQPIDY